ncbi:hypothetical protein L226DRAFT_137048 [Lentinus tigrinus ALCF2SS1-7]|uniref:Uncharacterized protein n=1 Tax=Lentinus tigrinus ALCF2SS1-6 TaxID=1328759 RepID=A0A5C2SUA8_9APHY|nr:hypothetical protein L227DRAFT_25387 [Lentinus tigrinus ALCF2SS1-6]RPD81403.1 hypothetical protein L226DRAFT_137048 [Lentinus tigrinus ALCF2SS1-7]
MLSNIRLPLGTLPSWVICYEGGILRRSQLHHVSGHTESSAFTPACRLAAEVHRRLTRTDAPPQYIGHTLRPASLERLPKYPSHHAEVRTALHGGGFYPTHHCAVAPVYDMFKMATILLISPASCSLSHPALPGRKISPSALVTRDGVVLKAAPVERNVEPAAPRLTIARLRPSVTCPPRVWLSTLFSGLSASSAGV